jgi:hypothetical protein
MMSQPKFWDWLNVGEVQELNLDCPYDDNETLSTPVYPRSPSLIKKCISKLFPEYMFLAQSKMLILDIFKRRQKCNIKASNASICAT